MLDDNKWTDAEMDIIKREASRMQDAGEKVTQRGLARRLHNKIANRTNAAIYCRVREMMSAGKGWWSTRGVGRQINVNQCTL